MKNNSSMYTCVVIGYPRRFINIMRERFTMVMLVISTFIFVCNNVTSPRGCYDKIYFSIRKVNCNTLKYNIHKCNVNACNVTRNLWCVVIIP